MGNMNKVMLLGRLGGDPEIRYTPSGAAVTNFTLATSENWKDKEGQRQEKTEWHKVVTFGKLAEICGEYLHKGKEVLIEGKIQTRKWEDKDGNDRYTTEIVAQNMQMCGDKGGGGGSNNASSSSSTPVDSTGGGMGPDDDDDIPF